MSQHIPSQPQDSDSASNWSEENQLDTVEQNENISTSIRKENLSSHVESSATEANSNNSKKRKRPNIEPTPTSRPPRRSSVTNEDRLVYLRLLNEQIHDIAHAVRYEEQSADPLPEGRIGCTMWTSGEKELFFDALVRYGRDDVIKIAEAVGNGKSPVQIVEYLTLLEEASSKLKLSAGALSLEQVPAATEVGTELRKRLQEIIRVIDRRGMKYEEQVEYEKWGDYWLLDANIAAEVLKHYKAEAKAERAKKKEEQLKPIKAEDARHNLPHPQEKEEPPETTSTPTILSHIPSARLLHLPNFLRLQANVYMNTRTRYAWQTAPRALRHTAFADLHNLAQSLTRRLVSATIFQTETRLRSRKHLAAQGHLRRVYRWDVLSALRVLGVRESLGTYWVGVPRRYGLVCTVRSYQSWLFERDLEGEVPLEVVEERLSRPVRRMRKVRKVVAEDDDDEMEEVGGNEEEEGSGEDESSGEEMEIDKEDGSPVKVESGDEVIDDASDTTSQEESGEEEDSSSEDERSEESLETSSEENEEEREVVESDTASSTSSSESDDDREFTRQELEAIYPAMFDQSQCATSEEQFTQQLRDMIGMLEEEAAEEDYLEEIDSRASQRNEKRLWAMLNDEDYVSSDGEVANTQPPAKKPTTGGAAHAIPTKNWRENTRDVSEWERRCMMKHSKAGRR